MNETQAASEDASSLDNRAIKWPMEGGGKEAGGDGLSWGPVLCILETARVSKPIILSLPEDRPTLATVMAVDGAYRVNCVSHGAAQASTGK